MAQKLKGSSLCLVHSISRSSPCLMRTLSDLFFDFSIDFSYLFISPIYLLFLLPCTFIFLDVVVTTTRTAAEEIGHHGQEQLLNTLLDDALTFAVAQLFKAFLFAALLIRWALVALGCFSGSLARKMLRHNRQLGVSRTAALVHSTEALLKSSLFCNLYLMCSLENFISSIVLVRMNQPLALQRRGQPSSLKKQIR